MCKMLDKQKKIYALRNLCYTLNTLGLMKLRNVSMGRLRKQPGLDYTYGIGIEVDGTTIEYRWMI